VDLGHGIKALQEAGMNQTTLTWNEGRWCLCVHATNDPDYQSKKFPNSMQLTKDVVTYLNSHMLPAPKNVGVMIFVSIPAAMR
jgi:hypothetical protein